MSKSNDVVTLSLISHTNVGKTTLARTLLRRDIGEVRDQPHVTDLSEAHRMVRTEEGFILRLWDTPGFGDSARLLRRLKTSSNPLGWFLTQVWDRFAERPLWCSQQAVRNVRDEADVVLYLVNAAEAPESAAYVAMEMEILEWAGVPVVVLLNQMGPPKTPAEEAAEVEKWRAHLRRFPFVGEVLSLDAFARCWVQEGTLLDAVGKLLPAPKQAAYARLTDAWWGRNLTVFRQSMDRLARPLAAAACDREMLERGPWKDRLRGLVQSLGAGSPSPVTVERQAAAALAERHNRNINDTTNELIRLHGLSGSAADEILERLTHYAGNPSLDPERSALLGGLLGGPLGGLAADIAAGGLTFGGGTILGFLLGVTGGGGFAKIYNLARGEDSSSLRWPYDDYEGLLRSALLRYLAIAHFGRGRGDYTQGEHPTFWQEEVKGAVANYREEIKSVWEQGKGGTDPDPLARRLEPLLAQCTREVIDKLYPGADRLMSRTTPPHRS